MRVCRQWRTAASKGTPRAVRLPLDAGSASALRGSPLLRHIGTVALDNDDSLSLALMQQLHALPGLTALRAALGSAELQRLEEQNGAQTLADLRSAFPPHLRELSLSNCTPAASQLLLDALPALAQLERLLLHESEYAQSSDYDSLSLASLLPLPWLVFLAMQNKTRRHSQRSLQLAQLAMPTPSPAPSTSSFLLPLGHEPVGAAVTPEPAAPSAASTEASAEPSRVSLGWGGDNSAAAEENRAGGARHRRAVRSPQRDKCAATRGGADP
jgi:hypothetical protein